MNKFELVAQPDNRRVTHIIMRIYLVQMQSSISFAVRYSRRIKPRTSHNDIRSLNIIRYNQYVDGSRDYTVNLDLRYGFPYGAYRRYRRAANPIQSLLLQLDS